MNRTPNDTLTHWARAYNEAIAANDTALVALAIARYLANAQNSK